MKQTSLPQRVRVVEVGPRDGLQNETAPISTRDKIELITRLADAGIRDIEAGSFVSPRWVPQMADSDEVMAGIPHRPGLTYSALTPNLRGLERAVAAGAQTVMVFGSASESFCQKNINCSIGESLERFAPVVTAARAAGLKTIGSLSCVLGCPYEGSVNPDQVLATALAMRDLGCEEINLADTIGVGSAGSLQRLLDTVLPHLPGDRIGMHFHDTYGQALTNVFVSLEYGIASFDSSVAGMGGCPYAKGATGNLATEDLVYLLNGLGIEHGVDLDRLIDTGHWLASTLGRRSNSRVANAMRSAA